MGEEGKQNHTTVNENNHFHEIDLGHVTETNHRIGLNRHVSFKSMFITLALLFRLVDFIS